MQYLFNVRREITLKIIRRRYKFIKRERVLQGKTLNDCVRIYGYDEKKERDLGKNLLKCFLVPFYPINLILAGNEKKNHTEIVNMFQIISKHIYLLSVSIKIANILFSSFAR